MKSDKEKPFDDLRSALKSYVNCDCYQGCCHFYEEEHDGSYIKLMELIDTIEKRSCFFKHARPDCDPEECL